jgi:hypothetical protein
VSIEDSEAGTGLLTSREIDETNNAVMRTAMEDGQLAKVFVERDENSLFGMSASENNVVAWILGPIA